MSVTTGYICKKCGEPSPVGVGYTSAQPCTGDVARCPCGWSVNPKLRLEELRKVIRAERISYGELAELQGMAEHIEPGDVELLEWAGVPEFPEDEPAELGRVELDRKCSKCGHQPKNARKLFLDAWDNTWKCDDALACKKRQQRAAAGRV